MQINKMLLAAGFVLAGMTAASAESGFEPRNDVPNGLTTKTERILQFNGTARSAQPHTIERRDVDAQRFQRTRNTGFAKGYSTFDVLDSIR